MDFFIEDMRNTYHSKDKRLQDISRPQTNQTKRKVTFKNMCSTLRDNENFLSLSKESNSEKRLKIAEIPENSLENDPNVNSDILFYKMYPEIKLPKSKI